MDVTERTTVTGGNDTEPEGLSVKRRMKANSRNGEVAEHTA